MRAWVGTVHGARPRRRGSQPALPSPASGWHVGLDAPSCTRSPPQTPMPKARRSRRAMALAAGDGLQTTGGRGRHRRVPTTLSTFVHPPSPGGWQPATAQWAHYHLDPLPHLPHASLGRLPAHLPPLRDTTSRGRSSPATPLAAEAAGRASGGAVPSQRPAVVSAAGAPPAGCRLPRQRRRRRRRCCGPARGRRSECRW